jgi:hypothetical protein
MNQRRLAMNKIAMLFSMLAAVLLLSALPAFSGSGPYGSYGLSANSDMALGVETQLIAFTGGSGPYGVFGPSFKGVDTPPWSTVALGSGPYGAFVSSGKIGWGASHQIANKDECLLVALLVTKNCPSDMNK